MKRMLSLTVAAVALIATTSIGSAQSSFENYDWYMTGSGDQRMIHSRTSGEATPLLLGENGARPSDCPAGSFYETAVGIAACDDETAMFDLTEPGSVAMDNGQPFEEGAMLLSPQQPPATENIGGSAPGGG